MKKRFLLDFMWGKQFLLEMEQFHDFWRYRPALINSRGQGLLGNYILFLQYEVYLHCSMSQTKFIHLKLLEQPYA